jgi:hypothetical protein
VDTSFTVKKVFIVDKARRVGKEAYFLDTPEEAMLFLPS